MSWFGSIIAGILNVLATGISALVTKAVSVKGLTHSVMGNIILGSGFFPHGNPPPWGSGNFSNLMDPKAVASLKLFSLSFWAFGWAFLLGSVYLLAIQVAGAAESSIQRERLKKGILSLIISAILIWQGSHLAVLVTQMFYYLSDYFLSLPHSLSNFSASTPSHTGGQQLLGSAVNLLQAVLSIVVWIVYQFRALFLYVWMLFFPLAMAFYANDKTRGIAKMWWTEWIYQMAIPFGQAVVFGVASAVASPTGGGALTASDVFVSFAGTIGLLASATYMRKLIDMVAQGFGASMIGANHGMAWGSMAMAAGAGMTGDLLGKASLRTGRAAAGKAFRKVDNTPWAKKMAAKQISEKGEVHAGAAQAGASMDDIMMHQKYGAEGDPIRNGGVGLEAASGGARGFGTGSGGARGGARGKSLPLTRTHTAGEIGRTVQATKHAFAHSNLGTWATTGWKGLQNEGGIRGKASDLSAKGKNKIARSIGSSLGNKRFIGRPVSAMTGAVANKAQRHLANRELRQERLETARDHIKEVMQNNAIAARVPGISHLYDAQNNTFQGLSSPAEQKHSAARNEFVNQLRESGVSPRDAQNLSETAQQQWDVGQHLPNLGSYTPAAQEAYRKAYATYQPAQLDRKAKEAVVAGRVAVTPPKDPLKTKTAGTNAFLYDARKAIVNGH